METNTAASRFKAIITFPVALLILLVGGVVTGITTAFVGSFFYLALLFPLGMGFAGGYTVTAATQLTRTRKTGYIILMCVLTALVIYGTYHYGRYVALQVQTSLEIFPGLTPATDEKNLAFAKAIVDNAIEKETGHTGFAGYMLLKAGDGVSIGRFYSQNRLELGPALTWAYWLLEFGVILCIAVLMNRKGTRVPACPSCGSPYRGEKHLGGTVPANESLLLDLVRRGDLAGLGRLLVQDTGLPSLEVYLERCEACQKSDAVLTVRRAAPGPMGSLLLTDLSKASLPPRESRLFLEQLSLGNS